MSWVPASGGHAAFPGRTGRDGEPACVHVWREEQQGMLVNVLLGFIHLTELTQQTDYSVVSERRSFLYHADVLSGRGSQIRMF